MGLVTLRSEAATVNENTGNECVPIQLAQCWFPGLAISDKYIFQIKYTEAVLSNSTRKLLRFEITNMLIAL